METNLKSKILELRFSGKSYAEIGRLTGVSKQYAHQVVSGAVGKLAIGVRGHGITLEDIKYKAFYELFSKNNVSYNEVVRKIYGNIDKANKQKFKDFLIGEHESRFTLHQINNICELLGKSFEEAFEKR